MPPARLNPANYVTHARVPILDDHTLAHHGSRTRIDAAFLRDVARNNNARYERTGDATPIVIGHTRDGERETDQPPVVGYATNFRVEKFGRDGEKVALVADFHLRKKYESAFDDYPRRSVELWTGRREVDPISLLGATTPERDLGVLRYSRDDEQVVLIESPHETQTMPPTRYEADDAKDTRSAEKAETSGARESGDKLDKIIALLTPMAEMFAKMSAEGGAGEGGGGQDDDLLGPAGGGGNPMPEEHAHQYSSSAGGNNGYAPDVTRMSRDFDFAPEFARQPSDELVRMQRQVDTVSRSNAELVAKLARRDAEAEIAQLEADEQIDFPNREWDVSVLSALRPAERAGFLEHVRKSYKRKADPTRASGLSRFARAEGPAGPQTQEQVQDEIAGMPGHGEFGLSAAAAVARATGTVTSTTRR